MMNLNFKKIQITKSIKDNAWTEIILGYALLVVVNFFLFRKEMGYVGVNPHPYWIIILLLATRYGYKAGLWSGLTGAILYLVLSQGQKLSMDVMTDFEMLIFKEPLLFIVVGGVIGEIREIQKRVHAELVEDYEELKKTHDTLKTHYSALSEAKQELDGTIISQKDTISTLYDAAQALRSLKENDVYPAVLGLLKNYIGAEAASIYAWHDNNLKLKGSIGDDRIERPQSAETDAGMMGLAIKAGKLVSIKAVMAHEENRGYLQSGILICAPIIDTTGKLYGVINVEKLPFVKFNPLTLRMTSLIADWCGSALENATIFQDVKDRDITDEATGAHSSAYLIKRLNEEFQRARRYKTPLSVMIVDLVGFNDFLDEKKDEIMSITSQIIQKMVRGVDLLFRVTTPGRYVLLLPNTDLAGARILNGKLLQEVEAFKFQVTEDGGLLQIRSGITGYNETISTPNHLLQAAADNLYEKS